MFAGLAQVIVGVAWQDVDRRRRGGSGVVGRVGGREGDRQALVVAGVQDRARGRRVGEGPGHVGRGVELGGAQGRAVDDVQLALVQVIVGVAGLTVCVSVCEPCA